MFHNIFTHIPPTRDCAVRLPFCGHCAMFVWFHVPLTDWNSPGGGVKLVRSDENLTRFMAGAEQLKWEKKLSLLSLALIELIERSARNLSTFFDSLPSKNFERTTETPDRTFLLQNRFAVSTALSTNINYSSDSVSGLCDALPAW